MLLPVLKYCLPEGLLWNKTAILSSAVDYDLHW